MQNNPVVTSYYVYLVSYSINSLDKNHFEITHQINKINKNLEVFQPNLNFSSLFPVRENSLKQFNTKFFKFDNRPENDLYKMSFHEVKSCTCGDYDCEEQDSIKKLFPEKRMSMTEYKKALKNPGLRTNTKKSVYKQRKNTLIIESFDSNGVHKTHGGDYKVVL